MVDMQRLAQAGPPMADPSIARDPIGQALALAQAGQPVPPALQRQVFQFAGAQGMSAGDLEQIFGVPAGTAAATVQSLGIADQLPMGLGGTIRPSPVDGRPVDEPPLRIPVDGPTLDFPVDTTSRPQTQTDTLQLMNSSIDSTDYMGGGGEGVGVDFQLPAKRPDGKYTQSEIDIVTEGLTNGTLPLQKAAEFYGVDPTVITSNLAQQGLSIPSDNAGGVTGGAGIPGGGVTGGAAGGVTGGVTGGSTIESLINKFKTTPQDVTQADTDMLINLAKQNNMDTFTLANMAGVTPDFLTNNLATMTNPATGQPYGSDYLRTTPTTTFGEDDGLGYKNVVVTSPEGAQTTIQREAPEIEARKLGLIDLAKQLAAKEPAGGMPQHQVAGLSSLEKDAYNLANQWKGKALNAVGEGWNTLGEVKQGLYDTYANRTPISDFGTKKYLEEYDPFLSKGIGTLDRANRRASAAGDVGLGVAKGAINELVGTTDIYDPNEATSYMNKYETDVIDAAMQDLTRAGEAQKQNLRARAVQQGAFGGSRAGLGESEIDRNVLQQQGTAAANLRMQGYNQAQANSLRAFEEAKRRGQQAAQLKGALGQQGVGASLNSATALANMANLTGRMGESRTQTGLAGVDQYGRTTDQVLKMGDMGRQVGINQGEMARLGQDVLIKDIASLEQAGIGLRGANQRALDAERANRMQDIQEPYQRASWMSDILRGAPSTQMEMVKKYEQQPSGAAQAIGGIGSLAATAAGAKRAGII